MRRLTRDLSIELDVQAAECRQGLCEIVLTGYSPSAWDAWQSQLAQLRERPGRAGIRGEHTALTFDGSRPIWVAYLMLD